MAESGLSKPPPSGDHEPAPKPKRYWWRFSVGSLIIVIAVAAATSASILLYIGSIATALSHHNIYNAKLHRYLSKVNGGEPENILILGSDKRANLAEDPGRSDTTILLRLDPDREAIAVMSIPRAAVMRSTILNHLIHHRAQLGVFLRMNDVAIPGMYGPSADDQKFQQAGSGN